MDKPVPDRQAADRGPSFTLHAADPLASMIVRWWAGMSESLGLHNDRTVYGARQLAAYMDEWRQQNRGTTP